MNRGRGREMREKGGEGRRKERRRGCRQKSSEIFRVSIFKRHCSIESLELTEIISLM